MTFVEKRAHELALSIFKRSVRIRQASGGVSANAHAEYMSIYRPILSAYENYYDKKAKSPHA